MSLTLEEVEKIAHLARLKLSDEDLKHYGPQLIGILDLIESMNQIDTSQVEPLAHPLNLAQRLRPDAVTSTDERAKYQAIAPLVEAGLYLVPKVIDEG